MTRSKVIDLAKSSTSQKMSNIAGFDFQAKLSQVIQEFCAEWRFWWRKKRFTFSTAANTATYDFTDGTTITTAPTGAGPYIEEITKVVLINSSGDVSPLSPVTDDESIATYENDTSTGQPDVWMPDMSGLSVTQALRLAKIPDAVYTVKVFFWAMPPQSVDPGDDIIYIVPSFLHHALQTGLEREIYRAAYGEEDIRFTSAAQLYNKKVKAATIKRSLDGTKVARFINQDDEAIRSTGNVTSISDLT